MSATARWVSGVSERNFPRTSLKPRRRGNDFLRWLRETSGIADADRQLVEFLKAHFGVPKAEGGAAGADGADGLMFMPLQWPEDGSNYVKFPDPCKIRGRTGSSGTGTPTFTYSKNGGAPAAFDADTNISVAAGDEIEFICSGLDAGEYRYYSLKLAP